MEVRRSQHTERSSTEIEVSSIKEIARKEINRVPIDEILNIEFKMFRAPEERHILIKKKYEENIHKIMNGISEWLGFGEIQKADKEKLNDAVRDCEESKLFNFVAGTFFNKLDVSFVEKATVVASTETGRFNCYSSTVFLADVLTRLGKPVNILMTPGHILLSGKEQVFETTAYATQRIIKKNMINKNYRIIHEDGVEVLVGCAWNNKGTMDQEAGRNAEAVNDYNNALKINPNDIDALHNLGVAFALTERYLEALNALDKTLELEPDNIRALENKIHVLTKNGQYIDAIIMLGKIYILKKMKK